MPAGRLLHPVDIGRGPTGKALWQQGEFLHVLPQFSAVHTIAMIEN